MGVDFEAGVCVGAERVEVFARQEHANCGETLTIPFCHFLNHDAKILNLSHNLKEQRVA